MKIKTTKICKRVLSLLDSNFGKSHNFGITCDTLGSTGESQSKTLTFEYYLRNKLSKLSLEKLEDLISNYESDISELLDIKWDTREVSETQLNHVFYLTCDPKEKHRRYLSYNEAIKSWVLGSGSITITKEDLTTMITTKITYVEL